MRRTIQYNTNKRTTTTLIKIPNHREREADGNLRSSSPSYFNENGAHYIMVG